MYVITCPHLSARALSRVVTSDTQAVTSHCPRSRPFILGHVPSSVVTSLHVATFPIPAVTFPNLESRPLTFGHVPQHVIISFKLLRPPPSRSRLTARGHVPLSATRLAMLLCLHTMPGIALCDVRCAATRRSVSY
eukprot:2528112-Rhodomonas_salina.1